MAIIEGEKATVRYIEYGHHVTDLTMLSGATSGWTFHDSGGVFSSLFLSLAGTGFLYGSRRTQKEFGVTLLRRRME